MADFKDKKGEILKPGDLIKIDDTVNGYKKFLVLSVKPLDIRYAHDISRKYRYDQIEFVSANIHGDSEFTIVGNVYEYIKEK